MAVAALYRTQYDELEEEEDDAMKRRTMALSSSDAPAQPSTRAASISNQVPLLHHLQSCQFGCILLPLWG